MTNTLKRLEDKGCIQLTSHASDGRSKEVSLTAKGRRMRDAAIAATTPDLAKLVDAMGEEEMREALPFLQALRSWLDTHR